MKKIGVLLIVFLFTALFVNVINAQDALRDKVEGLEETVDKAREFGEEGKGEYLGKEWKEILLKKPIIAKIDGFLRKINFIFIFLFGEDYDLSMVFFFAIVFWIFFFLSFNIIFRDFSAFKDETSLIISFLLAIILAHFKLYKVLSELLFKLIFYKEGIWWWIWFGITIVGFIVLYFAIKAVGHMMVVAREKQEKEIEKLNRELLQKQVSIFDKIWDIFKK